MEKVLRNENLKWATALENIDASIKALHPVENDKWVKLIKLRQAQIEEYYRFRTIKIRRKFN